MQTDVLYRQMRSGEEDQVFDLVKAGFDEFVLPNITQEGATEFFRAAREIIYDRPVSHFILVAETKNVIAGMIDVRTGGHICLFFVAKPYQHRGIGRGLLEQAIAECVANDPKSTKMDVHSSVFAVAAYKKLGFIQTKPEQMANGIRFVPMAKALTTTNP